MDVDKSLYMKDFLELRNNLGSAHNLEAKHILYTNLYNEFLPREIKKKVETVVEEIEEKTILIKGNKDVLFEDLPDGNIKNEVKDIVKDVVHDSPKEIIIDENDATDPIFQKDKMDGGNKETYDNLPLEGGDIDHMGGGRELKKIIINPNYMALDK